MSAIQPIIKGMRALAKALEVEPDLASALGQAADQLEAEQQAEIERFRSEMAAAGIPPRPLKGRKG